MNTVTIPFTQAGHIVQPGYVDPSAIEIDSYQSREAQFTVYGDDLYWRLSTNTGWITDFNWGDQGEGTEMKSIRVSNNPGADRTGTFTVSFYTDSERTVLKNAVNVTVSQVGENGYVISWNDDYYVNNNEVDMYSGTTQFYVLNNPGNGYIKYYWGQEVTATPETTAFTIVYDQTRAYDTQGHSLWMNFYDGPTFTNQIGQAHIYLTQEGDPNLPHAEVDNEDLIPQSGGTKEIRLFMPGAEVDHWVMQGFDGITFPDYPGENLITGGTNISAVTISAPANTDSYWEKGLSVIAQFIDQNDAPVCDTQNLTVSQEAYRPVKGQLFDSGELGLYLPWSFTGDVIVNVSVESGYYYALVNSDETMRWTGDTSTALTLANIASPNTGDNIEGYGFHLMCYTDAELTDLAYDDWGGADQFNEGWNSGENVPQVEVKCHYSVSADGETKSVVYNTNGFNYPTNDLALYDDEYYAYLERNQYTFKDAGVHTLSNIRAASDTYLQDWCQNIDAYEVEVFGYHTENSQYNGYGFHGDYAGYTFQGSTAMTAITFDEHLVLIGGDGTDNNTFDGCTSLVSISCYNPNEPTIYATSFNTITANTGTLHIPSGSSYPNWAVALGSNWTVVDDL